jgi:molecular chaperone DnaK
MTKPVTTAPKDIAIGIDLGTTNSCVSVVTDGVAQVIALGGYLTTPSVIAFTPAGKRLVGHAAKRQAITNPENTIAAMKRLIGRKYDELEEDPATAHQAGLVPGPNGDVRVQLLGTSYSLPELSAMLLQELRAAAEAHFQRPVKKAVITVPAYFNDNQRQATHDAGVIAGLDVIGIINEPTAAALAYCSSNVGERTVIVYDLGGGTFDVSLVHITADGVCEVMATGGDTLLGGEDFDARIMKWLMSIAQNELGLDLSQNRTAIQRLKFAAETAKCALAAEERTEITLPFIGTHPNGEGINLVKTLTRDEFLAMTADLVERTMDVCTDVLSACEVADSQIDDVLLVGGSSRLRAVQQALTSRFAKAPSQRVNPDEAVAIGAAIHAHLLTASAGPAKHLLDVTPQTLGLLTEGVKPYPVIPRNSRVPTKRTLNFPTRQGQRNVDLVVMQGDSPDARSNQVLGRFRVTGFGPEPTQVGVTFALDGDGIVKVSARDGAGNEQSLTVMASSGLSADEVARMTERSSQYLAEKKAEAERAGALQEAQKSIAILEKTRGDVAAAVGGTPSGAALIAKVASAIESARGSLASASAAELTELAARLANMAKSMKQMPP